MPNPYPTALRARAVRAYEDGADRYRDEVAERASEESVAQVAGMRRAAAAARQRRRASCRPRLSGAVAVAQAEAKWEGPA